jgi:ABC-type xylose transport system substrate-binding protein
MHKTRGSNSWRKARHRRLRASKPRNWCLVYGLKSDPDGEFYYVGQTRSLPEVRLKHHIKQLTKDMRSGTRMSQAQQWLRNVLAMGRSPIIEVIDPNGVWDTSEAVWIDRLIAAGHPLTNIASRVPQPFGEVLWA